MDGRKKTGPLGNIGRRRCQAEKPVFLVYRCVITGQVRDRRGSCVVGNHVCAAGVGGTILCTHAIRHNVDSAAVKVSHCDAYTCRRPAQVGELRCTGGRRENIPPLTAHTRRSESARDGSAAGLARV